VSKQHQKNWQPVKRLAIDEISMRKGQQNFKIVVSDIDRGKLLEVVDGHSQEKLTEALMTQPLHWREQEVSVDMWGVSQSDCSGFPKYAHCIRPISC